MPNPDVLFTRIVKVLPSEWRGVIGAAQFRHVSPNDFVRRAIVVAVDVARAEYEAAGRPSLTPDEPRLTRHNKIPVRLTESQNADLLRVAPGTARLPFLRRAIAEEIEHPDMTTDDTGEKSIPHVVALSDTEMSNLVIAVATLNVKRNKFVRLAVAHALARAI